MTATVQSYESVACATLIPHPQNPRRGDVDALEQSLQAHGQFAPIVVQRSTRRILAGNHTFMAASERLGWESIEVAWVDVDDDQARRILLAANRASDNSRYDDTALRDLLTALAETEDGLDGTLYGVDDLATLDALAATGQDRLKDVVEELGEPSDDELWPTLFIKVPPHLRAAFYEHTAGAAGGDEPSDRQRLEYLLAAVGWDGKDA